MKRFSLLLASGLLLSLSACAIPTTGTYPSPTATIGEIKDWRMPVYREPGRIDMKLRLVDGNKFRVSLEAANEGIQAPLQLAFTGCDCSVSLTASVRYSTEANVFTHKYFSKELDRHDDLDVRIEWDGEMHISTSLDGETLQVMPYTSFATLRLLTESGTIVVKELNYSKINEAHASAKGVK